MLSPGKERVSSGGLASRSVDEDAESERPEQQVKKSGPLSSQRNNSKRGALPVSNNKVVHTSIVRVALWEHFDRKFPYGYKTHFLGQEITHEGNNRFICSGKVDVTNAFNAKRTYLYGVEIKMSSESEYRVTASLIE